MEKNNNNTNYENPLTGEKVGEGEPTEEITKDPVDEIVHYGGEEVPQGHKDEFDPNAPKGSEEVQVNQVSKSRYRRSCNTSSG